MHANPAYVTRHSGMDCRNPEAMDGNAKSGYRGLGSSTNRF
jgi:hypothetical protein